MKTNAMTCVAMAALLLSVGQTYAQDRNGRPDGNCGKGRGHCEQSRGHEDNREQGRGAPSTMRERMNDAHRDERGAGPDQRFRRGDRVPPENRTYRYVVEDWHGHGLRAPPRGYHWVQSGGDYLLVAITTGVILDLLLSH